MGILRDGTVSIDYSYNFRYTEWFKTLIFCFSVFSPTQQPRPFPPKKNQNRAKINFQRFALKVSSGRGVKAKGDLLFTIDIFVAFIHSLTFSYSWCCRSSSFSYLMQQVGHADKMCCRDPFQTREPPGGSATCFLKIFFAQSVLHYSWFCPLTQ